MIHVVKGKAPEKLTGAACKALIADVCAAPDTHRHNGDYYGHVSVREALQRCYGNKCAYCETILGIGSSPRIDHFRPKNKIKGIIHLEYFWLTYEWSNLIQVCEKCNREKSNQFPLADEATRVSMGIIPLKSDPPTIEWTDPKGLKLGGEKSLLLNPEWDAVERHFTFTSDGRIHASTERGIVSIKVYGLNRDKLVLARRRKWERYENCLVRHLDDYANHVGETQAKNALADKVEALFFQMLYEDTSLLQQHHCEYSAFGFFMVSKFAEFVRTMPFPKEIGSIICEIKNKYKFS